MLGHDYGQILQKLGHHTDAHGKGQRPNRQNTGNTTEGREEATSTTTTGRRTVNENDRQKRVAIIGGGERWGGALIFDRGQDDVAVLLKAVVRVLQDPAVRLPSPSPSPSSGTMTMTQMMTTTTTRMIR